MLQVRQLSLTNVIFYFNKVIPMQQVRTKIPTVNLKTTKNN